MIFLLFLNNQAEHVQAINTESETYGNVKLDLQAKLVYNLNDFCFHDEAGQDMELRSCYDIEPYCELKLLVSTLILLQLPLKL